MDPSKPIIFYDIGSPFPTTYATNPWKTRYVLNFKRVQYKTEWVDLPDIASVRKRLGVAPVRTYPDGSPYYTLPIIHDLSTDELIGDSFDIALYLDRTYTEATNTPSLFPPSTIGLQRAWNAQIEAIFASFAPLCFEGVPLHPETAEITKAGLMARLQIAKWEDIHLSEDQRKTELAKFKDKLGELAAFYHDVEAPFLGGENPIYADLIVGASLAFYKITLPAKEWEEVQTWHDGLWGRINRALEKYAEIK